MPDLDQIVRRGMAVKVRYIQSDPYEQGERAALDLGHTIGHAVEHASGYHLRHGEAVSIGMVAAARMAEQLGVAQPGLTEQISSALDGLGLPSGWLVIFDRRSGQPPIAKRTTAAPATTPAGRTVTLIRG